MVAIGEFMYIYRGVLMPSIGAQCQCEYGIMPAYKERLFLCATP